MLLFQPHAAPATFTVAVDLFSDLRCLDAPKTSMQQGLLMSLVVDDGVNNLGKGPMVNLHAGLSYRLEGGAWPSALSRIWGADEGMRV